MITDIQSKLDFHKVKEQLSGYALSYLGREKVNELQVSFDKRSIERQLKETEEAMRLLASGSSVPIPSLEGIEPIMKMLGKGFMLVESDMTAVSRFLYNTVQLKQYMMRKHEIAPQVCSYASALYGMEDLLQEIERCVRNGYVLDDASDNLARTRKKLAIMEDRLKQKLLSTMNKYKAYLQDAIIGTRNERYVLAVKRDYKKVVKGSILDESASGQTVFIEPVEIASLCDDVMEFKVEEEKEKARILSYLTGLIEERQREIRMNLDTIGYYDFLMAKARYGRTIDGKAPHVNDKGIVRVENGRHPLLGKEGVPLNFSIGEDYRCLIITGPNTGGKTVTLKTVALLTLMVQCGLLVPVSETSDFSIFMDILADIGDGQSLEQSLSTFSSHVKNVISILSCAGPRTLVLLDELATGTDPGEGVGLSIAVLEELHRRGSTVIANTHFNEIKVFAGQTEGFENARMEFDIETLRPLYKLRIGEAGNSYAFLIAGKLGMDAGIIERAQEITGRQSRSNEESPTGLTVETPSDGMEGGARRPLEAMRQGKREVTRMKEPEVPNTERQKETKSFEIGDRVWIHAKRKSGIVCSGPDDRGNIVVMVQKQKMVFQAKRLSLYLTRDELYPEQYDLSIVTESKEARRKRKAMSRKHVPGMSLDYNPDHPKG